MSKVYLLNKYYILLIIVVGLLTYSNTFNSPFHFDDEFYITKNPVIRNLNFFIEPSGAEQFKGNYWFHTLKMRYIGSLTHALNYKLHGLNITGYHIFNLTIHILNAILVYWLVVLTLRTPFGGESPFGESVNRKTHSISSASLLWRPIHPFTYLPLSIALIFVSHPIQTQAVTYITQRFASLATMFYLLSLVMYIRWRFDSAIEQSLPSLP